MISVFRVIRNFCFAACLAGISITSVAQERTDDEKDRFFRKYIYSGVIQQKDFADTLAFQKIGNWVVVTVKIRRRNYHFVLDSGAPTAISEALVKLLHLKPVNEVNIADAAGEVEKRPLFRLPELQIGNVVFDDEGGFSSDFTGMSLASCVAIDGIIGANLMRKCNWVIDYQRRILIISDRPVSDTGSYKIPFEETDGGMPQIQLAIGDTSVEALFDTGLTGLPSFSPAILEHARKDVKKVKGAGLIDMGVHKQRSGEKFWIQLDTVFLGPAAVYNVAAELSSMETNLVGAAWFQGCRICIDWPKKFIYVVRTEDAVNDSLLYSYGFRYHWQDQKLLVSLVWEGTEAYISGVREGDQIMAIDGKSISTISHEMFCDLAPSLETASQTEFNIRQRSGVVKTMILARKRLL